MDLTGSITDKLFTQCIHLVGSEDNQKKLRLYIIDPLVQYFKHKLGTFFIIIIVLMSCLLIVNIVMISYMYNLKACLVGLKLGGNLVPL